MNKLLLGTLSLAVAVSLNASVLATVNGKKITTEDMNEMFKSQPGMTYDKLPKQYQEKFLNQVIETQLITDHAKKSGIEKTKEFKEALDKVKDSLAGKIWFDTQVKNAKVTDAQAKTFYDKNSEKFEQTKRAKIRHIIVKDEKTAMALIKELKALKGKKLEERFIALAKEKSTGPSAKRGGDLGWVGTKNMLPAFVKVAFSLKKGQVSPKPAKTQYGYHVILNEGNKPAKKIEYAKVKDSIKNKLKMDQVKAKIEDLRKKAKITMGSK